MTFVICHWQDMIKNNLGRAPLAKKELLSTLILLIICAL